MTVDQLTRVDRRRRLEEEDYEEAAAHRADDHDRSVIRDALARKVLSPLAVFAYTRLLLTTNDDYPMLPAEHHRLWVCLMCDPRIKQLLVIAPPESAKTSWAIMAFAGFHIALYPHWPVLVGSVSGETAARRTNSLRQIASSPKWQTTFPNIRPARGPGESAYEAHQWSLRVEDANQTVRIHPTVSSAGTLGTVIGGRARLLIGDDLLDFDSTRTRTQRENTVNWAYSSFFSRVMAQVGRKILIGNAWHYQDLYARCREEGGWVVSHTPMLNEDGPNAWSYLTLPDDWNPDELIGEPVSGDPYDHIPT